MDFDMPKVLSVAFAALALALSIGSITYMAGSQGAQITYQGQALDRVAAEFQAFKDEVKTDWRTVSEIDRRLTKIEAVMTRVDSVLQQIAESAAERRPRK